MRLHDCMSTPVSHLRRLREKAGITGVRLAQQAGLSRDAISKLERGIRIPSLPVFLRLVDVLSLTAGEALDLARELAGLPVIPAPPTLEGLPLSLDGQAVELLEVRQDTAGLWWALVRPSSSPTATARRVPLAGLALLPLPAVRAA